MSRVLVSEKLADAGVDLLREHADVDVEIGLSPEELADKIGAYDALLIRSATKVTADLIARADNLKVIGRAGVGVNNVDVPAASSSPTRRSPTSSRPRSRRSHCCSRSPATCRRRTAR
jgi:D-3-phosphoglycerate dehydrogenase / 2-oxoglutarate reductase